MRRIFGSKREEVLHNEELHNLYSSPDIIMMKWGRACSTHGKDEKCIQNVRQKTRRDEITWKRKMQVGRQY
jgi:hypothetical protein